MNFPRVTEADVDTAIVGDTYTVLPDGRTTICTLTLDNGYTVRGEATCVCPENFDRALGEQYSYADARRRVWPLLGFRLADKLARDAAGPRFRDATSGEYVTAEYARAHPSTTVRED